MRTCVYVLMYRVYIVYNIYISRCGLLVARVPDRKSLRSQFPGAAAESTTRLIKTNLLSRKVYSGIRVSKPIALSLYTCVCVCVFICAFLNHAKMNCMYVCMYEFVSVMRATSTMLMSKGTGLCVYKIMLWDFHPMYTLLVFMCYAHINTHTQSLSITYYKKYIPSLCVWELVVV